MKKIRILAALLAFTSLIFAATATASAANLVKLSTPSVEDTYYLGEKITCKFCIENVWKDYYALPNISLVSSLDYSPAVTYYSDSVEPEEFEPFVGTFFLDPRIIKPGEYYFLLKVVPTDSEYDTTESDNALLDDIEYIEPDRSDEVHVRRLNAPSNCKVVTSKGHNTITYRKARGATYYKIYRSKHKNSGYRQIGSISSTRYVDQTVKRGSRYYYKIKSVRARYNTISSSYSSKIRSGRVK